MIKIVSAVMVIISISGIGCTDSSHQTVSVTCLHLGEGVANCYVVQAEKKDAYIIDPGGNPDALLAYIKKHHLDIQGYLLTHAHNDHIRALPVMLKSLPARAGIHPDDMPLYRRRMGDSESFDLFFQENQTYGTGPLKFTIIHTPGHSPGGVCFYFEKSNILFTGDTLFKDGVGRTDLDGGRPDALQASLSSLATLPPQTIVFPGHGNRTVLANELSSE